MLELIKTLLYYYRLLGKLLIVIKLFLFIIYVLTNYQSFFFLEISPILFNQFLISQNDFLLGISSHNNLNNPPPGGPDRSLLICALFVSWLVAWCVSSTPFWELPFINESISPPPSEEEMQLPKLKENSLKS